MMDAEEKRIDYANERFLMTLAMTGYGRTIGKQVLIQMVIPAFTIGVVVGWFLAALV